MNQVKLHTVSDRGKLVKALVKRGLLSLVILSCASFIWLAIWPPAHSRIDMNHRRAVASVRNLSVAEKEFAVRNLDQGYACKLDDLASTV